MQRALGVWFVSLTLLAALVASASASPGGWVHLGDGGTAGTPSLNGAVSALSPGAPANYFDQSNAGGMYVGGSFTDAGGDQRSDRIAIWDGTVWSPLSSYDSQISNGAVNAIAHDGRTVYVGGTFTDAGGNPNADFLAVWNGSTWGPFCNGGGVAGAPITATVFALQIIGRTLYVAGAFANAAGIQSADYLVACDLDTGVARTTISNPALNAPFSGAVDALTATGDGTLYAGGAFSNLETIQAADDVAYLDSGGWHAMGSGGGSCGCAIPGHVRSLAAAGTDVYVGTDDVDVTGIAQADHVVRWNGTAWAAVGSNTAGDDGWFPSSAFIYGLTADGTDLYATGSFQNANGDPTADAIARYDGTAWHAVGSDGTGNGPWNGNGLAVAVFKGKVHAGGNFTSAGGDTQARSAAVYSPGYTLTVTRAGCCGSVVWGPPQMNCPDQCFATFAPGTVVDLYSVTSLEATFDGWSGGCSGIDCSVTMDADKVVTATWHEIPYCFSGQATVPGEATSPLDLFCRNDTNQPFTYGIEQAPVNGTLGVPGLNGEVFYTPKPGFSGSDIFHYVATAANGVSRYANFSVNVTPVTTAPTFAKASQATTVWRLGGALPTIARARAPVGTIFTLAFSQQARISLAFTQRVTKRGSNRKRRVTRGTLTLQGHSGVNKVHFAGRISRSRKLKPGRYTVIIRAVNAEHKRSKARALTFTIVK